MRAVSLGAGCQLGLGAGEKGAELWDGESAPLRWDSRVIAEQRRLGHRLPCEFGALHTSFQLFVLHRLNMGL